jgi:hypothetical protein
MDHRMFAAEAAAPAAAAASRGGGRGGRFGAPGPLAATAGLRRCLPTRQRPSGRGPGQEVGSGQPGQPRPDRAELGKAPGRQGVGAGAALPARPAVLRAPLPPSSSDTPGEVGSTPRGAEGTRVRTRG